jgi:uncharacterized membrane protein
MSSSHASKPDAFSRGASTPQASTPGATAPGQPPRADPGSLSDHIGQNIASVVALHRRESESVSVAQRRVERISRFMGRPLYLIVLLALAAAWVAFNSTARILGLQPFDAPPFEILNDLMSLIALVTTTIVLIAQNRQAKLEQQHTHLDLQVNLLTEQKVTKLIHLIEELRRDLPMVKDRHDVQATALQERADAAQVLSAIEEMGLTHDLEEPQTPAGKPDK